MGEKFQLKSLVLFILLLCPEHKDIFLLYGENKDWMSHLHSMCMRE